MWYRTDLAWDYLDWPAIADGTAGWMLANETTDQGVNNMRSFFTAPVETSQGAQPFFVNQTSSDPTACGVSSMSPRNATIRCSIGGWVNIIGQVMHTTTLYVREKGTTFKLEVPHAPGASVTGEWWNPTCPPRVNDCRTAWVSPASGVISAPDSFTEDAVLTVTHR